MTIIILFIGATAAFIFLAMHADPEEGLTLSMEDGGDGGSIRARAWRDSSDLRDSRNSRTSGRWSTSLKLVLASAPEVLNLEDEPRPHSADDWAADDLPLGTHHEGGEDHEQRDAAGARSSPERQAGSHERGGEAGEGGEAADGVGHMQQDAAGPRRPAVDREPGGEAGGGAARSAMKRWNSKKGRVSFNLAQMHAQIYPPAGEVAV